MSGKDSDERHWTSQTIPAAPEGCVEGKKTEKSSESLSPQSKAEVSVTSEMDAKGDSKGKGKGGSGAKGSQQGPNPKSPKGKGEDHQGIRKDLEKIEQKVDILLEKMDKFTKEAEATLLGEKKEEKPMKPQPKPQPQPQPQAPPPQPAQPSETQQQQQAPAQKQQQAPAQKQQHAPAQQQQQAPAHQQGGKSHRKSKGAGKAAAAETGSGGKSS
ncbi:uncharacterized protein LOC141501674 isoform X2 [Macrotis lagotis]|uniref:uncharacterized protein LOC141501674 isoform X2 n=1 Tax=Macrotis lagotis TaxID=92651 RepID=UPI003D695738